MELEAIIWIHLPMTIAVFEVILTFMLTIDKNSRFNSIASLLILILNGLSIYILVAILNGDWPTYTPHLAIATSTVLTLIQIVRHKRNNKTFGNNGEQL